MNNRLNFIKTTVVAGFVFLISAVIVVVALGKLVGALKALAQALTPTFRIESFAGGVVLDLFALARLAFLWDCWLDKRVQSPCGWKGLC